MNSIKPYEGYQVIKYVFRYDEVAGDTGYWHYDARFITGGSDHPWGGPVSNFRFTFTCDQFKELQKYSAGINNTSGDSLNADQCFFLDKETKDVYFVVAAKGRFLFLKRSLCRNSGKDLAKYNLRPMCKYAPKQISAYPFFIPVEYVLSDQTPIETIRSILNLPQLERVKADPSKFHLCF